MRVVLNLRRQAGKMSSSQIFTHDDIIQDLIGVHVEKILLNGDLVKYDQVVQMLNKGDLTFSDCYAYPAILNAILRQVFGIEHKILVQAIKIKLHDFEDQKGVAKFIEILSM